MPPSANIARHLTAMARAQPDTPALKIPRGRTGDGRIDYLTLTFAELDAEVDAWVQELRQRGVAQGDRVLLMVRQGLPLIAAAFALFKHGAVPVVIDPGMGLKSFLSCVRRSRPRALLGIPLARILSHVCRGAFSSVQVRIPASGNPLARRLSAAAAGAGSKSQREVFPTAEVASTDLAAVLFTSGSTGAPKGVCYEHGMFAAQVELIRATYDIRPGEIDLPMLPIFALFNPALGMTTVVPEIDPSRPASVDPAKIVQAVRQENVTNSFGSPTLWNKIAGYCSEAGTTLPSLKRVLCAGAPVPASLWQASAQFLPSGKLHSPYGATEALPISTIASDQVDSGSVRGACVGRAVAGLEIKVIEILDQPIRALSEVRELEAGEIGELIVRGAAVTQRYDDLAEATAAAKIPASAGEADQRAWHRMGDCGYKDSAGAIWFCGRKVERVETAQRTLFTEPCEQVFRSHPQVERCALVGLGPRGAQTPALVVQLRKQAGRPTTSANVVAAELRERARAHAHTAGITQFFFHPNFPVDVRHNAKIHRLTLARWAATQKPVLVS
jgi:olefin beta-lactone synthetase